jgi:hypothetical protein
LRVRELKRKARQLSFKKRKRKIRIIIQQEKSLVMMKSKSSSGETQLLKKALYDLTTESPKNLLYRVLVIKRDTPTLIG